MRIPGQRNGGAARRARLGAIVLALAVALTALASPAEAAKRRVPYGFFGVNWTAGTPAPTLDTSSLGVQRREAKRMAAAGVESLRFPFLWSQAQPWHTWREVPAKRRREFVTGPGGVPTTFKQTDRYVRLAVERRIKVLPFVLFAPSWASTNPRLRYSFARPSHNQTYYDNYLIALVQRYGPQGSFWKQNRRLPKRPLREWQIWHEPNVDFAWLDRPYPQNYTALLKGAYVTLHRVDPGSRVVMAGLPNRSWDALDAIYKAGAKGYFDAVAIHPFTKRVSDVFRIIRLNRQVMARYGDSNRPMYLTELAWSTARGNRIPRSQRVGIEVSERQQNANLKSLYGQLAKQRKRLHIARAYWVNWSSIYERHGGGGWDFAGLVRAYYVKPYFKTIKLLRTYTAVARKLEGCKKTTTATRCAHKKHKRRRHR
jgi:hypothetical protein